MKKIRKNHVKKSNMIRKETNLVVFGHIYFYWALIYRLGLQKIGGSPENAFFVFF